MERLGLDMDLDPGVCGKTLYFLCLMFKLGNVETGTNQPISRHPSGSVTKVDGGLQSAFVEPLPIKVLVNLTV